MPQKTIYITDSNLDALRKVQDATSLSASALIGEWIAAAERNLEQAIGENADGQA